MSRSRLQGKRVEMSYFYSLVDCIYDFDDNRFKGDKHSPKELSFPLQSSEGLHAKSWPGMGVSVTPTTCRALGQLIFTGWALIEPVASHRTLHPASEKNK